MDGKHWNEVMQQVEELKVEGSWVSAAECGVQGQPGLDTKQEDPFGAQGPWRCCE